MIFSDNILINYFFSFSFILIFSIFIRQKVLTNSSIITLRKEEKLSTGAKWSYSIAQSLTLIFGLFILAKQYSIPKFGWDSVIYWVPRMKEVASGGFMPSLSIGFPSYPPLWIIIGSHALHINSNFLYLLPIVLIIHLVLATGDYLKTISGKKLILYIYPFFIPTFINLIFSMYALELYANFIVATFLSLAFFLNDRLEEKRIWILLTIVLIAAVLSRPEAIVFVGLWFIVKFIQSYKEKRMKPLIRCAILIFLSYISWTIFYISNGISNPITGYLIQGAGQINENKSLVVSKAIEILQYNLQIMALDQIYWFILFYVLLAFLIKGSKFWFFVNILCFSYLIFEYLTVPVAGKSTMKWWLQTGYLRMFGVFSLWIFFDFLIKLNSAMEITSKTLKRGK
ncbi:MAG: hypothetical protein WCV81_01775 [Microgenomates group bacterium]